MKDNRLEELKKEGWERMQVILEHEMPHKKDDKRFPFLWLFLGMGIAVLGINLLNVFNTSTSTEPTLDHSRPNIALKYESRNSEENKSADHSNTNGGKNTTLQSDSEKKSQTNSDIENKNLLQSHSTGAKNAMIATDNQKSISSSKNKTLAGSKFKKKFNNDQSETILENNIHSQIATHDNNLKIDAAIEQKETDINSPMSITRKDLVENENVKSPGNPNSELSTDNKNIRSNSDISTFSEYPKVSNSADPKEIIDSVLLKEQEALVPQKITNNTKKRTHKYDFFLSTGINRNASTHKISNRVGIMQMYTFQDILSLAVGSEFEYSKADLVSSSIPNIFTISKLLEENSSLNEKDLSMKGTENYRVFYVDKEAKLVNSVKSINIPIRLQYNITSRLSAGAGIELSYLLNRSSMNLDSFPFTCLVSVESPNLRYIRIRNSETRYNLGIQYRVFSRFSLSADISYYRDNFPFESINVLFNGHSTPTKLSAIQYSKDFVSFGLNLNYRLTK
ncbi:MAG: hypothetical protein HOP11_00720 [Saprospiraceae bacterium]|nr:hypothetical protein [Saprospiraceae bacterium]